MASATPLARRIASRAMLPEASRTMSWSLPLRDLRRRRRRSPGESRTGSPGRQPRSGSRGSAQASVAGISGRWPRFQGRERPGRPRDGWGARGPRRPGSGRRVRPGRERGAAEAVGTAVGESMDSGPSPLPSPSEGVEGERSAAGGELGGGGCGAGRRGPYTHKSSTCAGSKPRPAAARAAVAARYSSSWETIPALEAPSTATAAMLSTATEIGCCSS